MGKPFYRTMKYSDISWSRLFLLVALLMSLTANYILFSDNAYMYEQFKYMRAGFVEDVMGYNYCGEDA